MYLQVPFKTFQPNLETFFTSLNVSSLTSPAQKQLETLSLTSSVLNSDILAARYSQVC
jgi:hypothetical protein